MRGALPLAGLLLLGLVGCTSPPATLDERLGTPSPTATAAPPPTPTRTVEPFPTSCRALLTGTEVLDALGRDQLSGTTTFVYAGPVPAAGRLERTTCKYGVIPRGTTTVARVEVSLVRYSSAAAAAERVEATADSASGSGKRVQRTQAQGLPAYLVSEPASTYLTVLDGTRTLVVTLSTEVSKPPRAVAQLQELARVVLGFPAASPAPA